MTYSTTSGRVGKLDFTENIWAETYERVVEFPQKYLENEKQYEQREWE